MAHPSPVLRVAVVEDDARFRSSLEMFFTNTPEFSLTGTYRSARAALEALDRFLACGEEAPWDLVLMDLELPGMSGIEATRRLKERSPTLPVIVLTVFEEPGTILEAITSGADGYLVKRITAVELRSQLGAILRDGSPLTPGVARTVLSFLRGGQTAGRLTNSPLAPARFDLTEREQDVLRCIVRGMSYKQAAEHLSISLETVRTHIRNLYRKLRVHSVAEAVSQAIRKRII